MLNSVLKISLVFLVHLSFAFAANDSDRCENKIASFVSGKIPRFKLQKEISVTDPLGTRFNFGVSSSGRYAALRNTSENIVHVVNLTSGENIYLRHTGWNWVKWAAFSPREDKIAVFSNTDKSISIWELPSGKLLRVISGVLLDSESTEHGFREVLFSPDGKKILALNRLDNSIMIFDVESGLKILTLKSGNGHIFPTVEFSKDGRRLLVVSDDYRVRIWNIETGKCLRSIKFPRGSWNSFPVQARFSAKEDFVIVETHFDNLYRVNLVGSSLPKQLLKGRVLSTINELSPDEKYLVVSLFQHQNELSILDAKTEKLTPALPYNGDERFNEIHFTSNPRYFVSTSNHDIKFWDIQTGREIAKPITFKSRRDVFMSVDGRTMTILISRGWDGATIQIWKDVN